VRDLALAALASATTLIAIYAAGLIFVAQHVADRYTPVLYPVVVSRIGLLWLGPLSLIILGSLALTLIRETFWTNIGDAAILVAAVLITVLGLFKTFEGAANRARVLAMVKHLRGSRRTTALRDLIWNSVSRGDVTSTEFLLNFSPYGSAEQADLLDWTTQYSQLLEQSWLRQAILNSLTAGDFNEQAAKLLEPALNRFTTCCLDREWYDSVHDIIIAVVRAVGLTSKFTGYHRYAIFDLGFNLHYLGEEGSATVRTSQRSPDSLQDARDLFLSHITTIRRSVVGDNDPPSVTQFCMLLQQLAEAAIGAMYVSSQIWEVLEDSYKHGLIEQDALEALASTIGESRYHWEENSGMDDKTEYLDRVSAHLALYIVALGFESQLGRMMGNARLSHPKRMPSRFAMHNELDEGIYTTVAKRLGYRKWPKPEGQRHWGLGSIFPRRI
jgi:hypothetical protein